MFRFLVLLFALGIAPCGAAFSASLDPTITSTIGHEPVVAPLTTAMPAPLSPSPWLDSIWPQPKTSLRGRTLAAATVADITLNPHEVILSFDDGPAATLTPGVLKVLDDFGVKAIFMMVGKMAELHPKAAQAVALDGQTIGTHTYDHKNLSKLTPDAALADIQRGQDAVAAALAPVSAAPSRFFRFPYLAQTEVLRASLAFEDTIVLGIQIDSDDYMRATPDVTLTRLLESLDKKGKGIVLFHDIHAKTLIVLPQFLQALADRGYAVVQLVAKQPSVFSEPVVTATR